MTNQRKTTLVVAAGVIAVLIVGGLFILGRWSTKGAREHVIKKISERFDSDVELRALDVSFLPRPSVHGEGLVLRHHGRTDVPPLISIDSFDAYTGWLSLSGDHISEVRLVGLKITVAPKQESGKPGKAVPVNMPSIGRIVADGAVFVRLPKKAGKDPMEWDLKQLVLTDVDSKGALKYQTKLVNAKPPGLIDAAGHFGPWNADDPGQTPLDGDYTFKDANLDVFTGIGGTLSAKGAFNGLLDKIQTHGTTDTPDFSVETGGQPVHLTTQYDAVVDGTDGDTYLDPVRASFGHTVIVARGAIEGSSGRKGKNIRLDVHTERARVEDILRLVVKSDEPVLTGNMHFNSKFFLPSGPGHVIDKLQLDGQFGVGGAHFETAAQDQIDTLSRKGQGEPKNTDIDNVAANLRGLFRLANDTMTLSRISFTVPGANVFVDGTYGLKSQDMNFDGHLIIDAPVSKTMTGFKSVLLKMADPMFKNKSGKGSSIPIRISGTPTSPHYGIDVKKALHRE